MGKRILLIALIGLSFVINAQEKIQTEIGLKNDFIYKNGNIGIGTTNPVSKLHINSDSNNTARAIIDLGSASNNVGLFIKSSNIASGSYWIKTEGNNPEGSFVVRGDGNIGIGTTNPASKLHINSDSNNTARAIIDLGSASNNVGLFIKSSNIASGSYWIKTEGNNPAGSFVVRGDGNVGIGTTSPSAKLDIYGNNNPVSFKVLGGTTNANSATINLGVVNGRDWEMVAKKYVASQGYALNFNHKTNDYQGPITFSWMDNEKVRIEPNGNVGIGTTNPGLWKLAVNGKIKTKEIKVTLDGWSDFVFEKDYALPTLKEVENHIKEKGHLQDIPSAKEVEKNGIYLGEMDAKLLQKIEELTLYTIAQEKKIEKIEKENESLKFLATKFLELQKRLKKLEKE